MLGCNPALHNACLCVGPLTHLLCMYSVVPLCICLSGSRWAGLAAKDSSDEEEDDPAAARAAAAAAERQAAVTRQLKEQLTAILLEVTDKMFGEWQGVPSELHAMIAGWPAGVVVPFSFLIRDQAHAVQGQQGLLCLIGWQMKHCAAHLCAVVSAGCCMTSRNVACEARGFLLCAEAETAAL